MGKRDPCGACSGTGKLLNGVRCIQCGGRGYRLSHATRTLWNFGEIVISQDIDPDGGPGIQDLEDPYEPHDEEK